MRTKWTTCAAAGALLLGACNDASSPENFNPTSTGQKMTQSFGALDNKAVQSMAVLSDGFTFATTATTVSGYGLTASSDPADVFPCTACLGKTFVYDTGAGRYEASDQAGAPANGIRYLLYAVNWVQRTVVQPLQQVGSVDLTDKSSPASNTLGIKAVADGVTLLDYDATGSITGTTGTFVFTAKGFVTDGPNRLDFDLSQTVGTSDFKVDYKVTAPAQDNLGIRVEAGGALGEATTSTLTVTEGSDKLEIKVENHGTNSTGSVVYNNRTIATLAVAGNGDPVFTSSGGRVLTPGDLAGLRALFYGVDTLFERFDNLLVPAYFVFAPGR